MVNQYHLRLESERTTRMPACPTLAYGRIRKRWLNPPTVHSLTLDSPPLALAHHTPPHPYYTSSDTILGLQGVTASKFEVHDIIHSSLMNLEW